MHTQMSEPEHERFNGDSYFGQGFRNKNRNVVSCCFMKNFQNGQKTNYMSKSCNFVVFFALFYMYIND